MNDLNNENKILREDMEENKQRKEIKFQVIDISSDDVPVGYDYWEKEFIMTFYGKTLENENVVCNVVGFKPYFYMRVPGNSSISFVRSFLKLISKFINDLKKNTYNKWNGAYESDLLEVKKYYNFYGYNYDIKADKVLQYKFAKLSFSTYGDMRKCISAIQTFYKSNYEYSKEDKIITGYKDKKPILRGIDSKVKSWFNQEHNCECSCNLYEAKVHPLLRFLHEKKIKSCGWVRVSTLGDKVVDREEQQFNVDIEVNNVPLKDIQPIESDSIAGFITCSFDIECDSSHGDFPNPCKDFKKLVIDIYESYFRTSVSENTFTLKKKFIERCIIDAFNKGSNDVQNIYTLNGCYSEESLKNLMEDIDPQFIDAFDSSKGNTKERESVINKMTEMLNDIENDKGDKIMVKGDPIIQIGSVFHKYGDTECYNRSMVIIGNEESPSEKVCDDIEGVNIFECRDEKELLLKWKDLILYHNPDIITGYNIFGFDFDYINKRVDFLFPCCSKCKKSTTYSRCHKSCPKNDFYRLGKLMRNRESDRITDIRGETKASSSQGYYDKYWEKKCQVMSKQLSSSGLGDNVLKYISMDGRIVFDIQKEIQKAHSLDSYKLDDVSAHFMKGRFLDFEKVPIVKALESCTRITTNTIGNLKTNDYITININTKYGLVRFENGKKYPVRGLNYEQKVILITGDIKKKLKKYKKEVISYEWCLAKDDISPQQIFDYHKMGGSSGRAKVAKHCIMDCELCIHLLLQLDLIPNNIGMATVSWVPLSYIFLRGQGIKINSIITKECSERNTRIPTLKGFDDSKMDDGFEGAVVLDPKPGIYLDDPVSVLDYASLYPSSIIEKNLSHETFICTGSDIKKDPIKYGAMLEKIKHYDQIEYDDYIYEKKGKTIHKKKADTKTNCYFAKRSKEKQGIIPIVLQTLLDQRRETRSRIKKTNDENKKKVLDGLQLAYKITANSVYGQMGAKTSPIFFKKIAACTTAIGRERIDDAEEGVIEWAKEEGYNKPEIVYGDTDSVFVKFSRIHKDTGEKLSGKEALSYCIDCGVKAGEWITKHKMNPDWDVDLFDKGPQDLEYEKTFYPFILISKKRYTGDKYELSSDKPKERTSMGIVMKRRDNAPIVKYVFGNVIEIIMNQKSVDLAISWLKETLKKIKGGEMDESNFIISKSLRGYYKNPEGIAHKVLADRMAERNPGNKPKPNDRIPYIYRVVDDSPIITGYKMVSKRIENGTFKNGKVKYKTIKVKGPPKLKKRNILQGNRIEHPDYIRENNIPIDYSFYISNQIMNPVKQVLDLEKDENETQGIFDVFIKQ